ncbi:hypothetical protein WAE56_16520 [Iodobacter sp. LRB]|uniref:hypothetical protein n=1 Tax=unclassified Iodobacter TaxID=235634 RepID=UPI000C0CDBBB|nr:hypothetical protein [Iodobacter sp. BJB302]PHV00449.1 hypothetical protein CSQ88_17110 [Iodobacter sp. BJB302]
MANLLTSVVKVAKAIDRANRAAARDAARRRAQSEKEFVRLNREREKAEHAAQRERLRRQALLNKQQAEAEKQRLRALAERSKVQEQNERERVRVVAENKKRHEQNQKALRAERILAEKAKVKANWEAEVTAYRQRCEARVTLKNMFVNKWVR